MDPVNYLASPYDPEDGVTLLEPPEGFDSLVPTGIAADGTIVGNLLSAGSGMRPSACIYRSETGVVDLNDVVSEDKTRSIFQALAIADNGEVLVRGVREAGEPMHFVLSTEKVDMPETPRA